MITKNKLKRAPKFVTFWTVLVFVLVNIIKPTINLSLYKTITVFTITITILGIFIIRAYNNNIKTEDKLRLHIDDILFHWIPLLYILLIVKIPKVKNNIWMFIIPFLFILLHSSIHDYRKIYYYTGWSKNKTIIIGGLVYLSVLSII